MKSITNVIRLCFLALFFFTPLIFTSFNSELFELPKMYFVYGLTTILLSLHLINYFRGRVSLFKRTILDIPLLLFLISQTISTFISVDPHTSIFGYYSRLNGGLLSVISYVLLYFILVVYLDDKFKNHLINLFLFSGFLISGFGIAEHFGIDKNMWVQDVQSRVFSTLGQPNWLAAYLCILLPFSLDLFLVNFKNKKNILAALYASASVSFYLCLLFTKSKSGIIAAIISLFVFFVLYLFKSFKDKSLKSNLKPIIPLFIIITLISVLFNNPIKDRIFPPKAQPVAVSGPTLNITPSEDIRKIVWKGTLELWKKFPFFGTGTETFAYTYYWTRPVEHNLTSEWDFLYNKAHNEYLNYLATTGTVGFVAYLLVILFVIFNLLKEIWTDKTNSAESLAVFAAYLSILITNIAGFTVVMVSIFFFLLPILAITPKLPKEKNSLKTGFISRYRLLTQVSYFFIIIFGILILQKTLFYYLADISYAQSQSADAKEDYELAYKLIQNTLNFRQNEPVYFSQASLLASKMAIISVSNKDELKSGNYIDSAINYSNIAVHISPANTNLWKERAQMYYYLSSIDTKYFKESINSLTKVTVLAPTDAKSYYLIGQFLDAAKLSNEAVPYFEKAISLKSNYDHAYFALGAIELEQKDYSNALKNFNAALKINPQNTQAKDYINQINKEIKTKN